MKRTENSAIRRRKVEERKEMNSSKIV